MLGTVREAGFTVVSMILLTLWSNMVFESSKEESLQVIREALRSTGEAKRVVAGCWCSGIGPRFWIGFRASMPWLVFDRDRVLDAVGGWTQPPHGEAALY